MATLTLSPRNIWVPFLPFGGPCGEFGENRHGQAHFVFLSIQPVSLFPQSPTLQKNVALELSILGKETCQRGQTEEKPLKKKNQHTHKFISRKVALCFWWL